MLRRQFNQGLVAGAAVWAWQPAVAQSLAGITDREAFDGLRAALEKGALVAVSVLGKADGFLGNPKVRIPMPGFLEDGAKLLKVTGQGKRVDELVTSMNRAAEAAVPLGKDLLVKAVRNLSVDDARRILTGGDNSVTTFFADKTRSPLSELFLPVVQRATEGVGLADKYNRVASKASGLGLLKPEESNIQRYVTTKTLDGLYLIIGEEERKLRQDPVGAGSALLKKVFGALK
jgi:hypothetical protein